MENTEPRNPMHNTCFGQINEEGLLTSTMMSTRSDTANSWDDKSTVIDRRKVQSKIEESRTDEAISRLENLTLSFLSQLTSSLSRTTQSSNTSGIDDKRIVLELASRRVSPHSDSNSARSRLLQFPRNSKGPSARTPAQLLRVVCMSHEALVNQIPMTKRDLYYRDISLFKKQGVVDVFIDDLAATFSLSRSDLNIRASLKGLYCGSALKIRLLDGTTLVGHETESSLIPCSQDIAEYSLSEDIYWVLIVEKDAVFQTLRSACLTRHPLLPGPGLLGKGYPDLATRQLVKTLSDNLPENIPILALVDADAYGIDIVSVYKYGSITMRHESESLAAERVEWIGVSASEVLSLGVDKDELLPISIHDQRKAFSLLRSKANLPQSWRRELMHLLHNRRKAETEVLSSLTDASITNCQNNSHESSSSSQQQNPLVLYVIRKITSRLNSLCLEKSI
ncbi:topoisomerase acting in meiosis [Pyrrhoderma noxium]|uniref:DNA topoisomerase (ATP-hydrolyzing) n=1 Tax=Pyrrhoderma noxium TaxID=2282107 RepID=A0A286UGZ5_9AGAM|nr:topoisomerase acting in meiosis [Pyrrhoderma noxium]